MNNSSPSPWRIFSVDYPAMLAALFPVITWIFYLATTVFNLFPKGQSWDPLMGDNGNAYWFWAAVVFTVAGVPGFIWRMTLIRGLLTAGEETSGVVHSVSFYRDRGRVEYRFFHRGSQIDGWNALHKCRYTSSLHLGQEVTVLFDPQNPKKALIKDLYID